MPHCLFSFRTILLAAMTLTKNVGSTDVQLPSDHSAQGDISQENIGASVPFNSDRNELRVVCVKRRLEEGSDSFLNALT